MGRPKCFERNQVLDKAIQVFWLKGYAETSLQDLEKATGVNKSGLYSEFKDKDDLLTNCLKRFAQTNGVLELLSRHPLGRRNLEDFLLHGKSCEGQRGCFVANSVREYSILPAAAKAEVKKHVAEVRAAVRSNVQALVKGESDIDVLTDMILTFNSGMALRLNVAELPRLRDFVQRFLDGILAGAGG